MSYTCSPSNKLRCINIACVIQRNICINITHMEQINVEIMKTNSKFFRIIILSPHL